ncbi:MAG: hypothetical protein QOF68_1489 [Gaiellales bacterium]|jgi:hypothetical protein|nr:hypothetical protein [Gaiellales bacterium]
MRYLLAVCALAATVLVSAATTAVGHRGGTEFEASLKALPHNHPAAGLDGRGEAEIERLGQLLRVELEAQGLSPNLAHLIHIHGDLVARNECPTLAEDTNHDGLISFAEGVPKYGPVQVSFTKFGDTSAASAGDLARFPVASPRGKLRYERDFRIPADIARRLGHLHIVVHGVDLNGNGMYDDAVEITQPALCGRIVRDD